MPSSTTSSRPTRVILVDDNPEMLDRAARVLAASCAIVAAVNDGSSALQQALALEPDVVVLDISMPGMSGLEVAVRLRDRGSKAAVVFLTVHEDAEVLRAAKAAGAVGYVVKPHLAADLARAVGAASAGGSFFSGGQ
jgi:DNA-binding NarL/FixJ family response regulator